MADLRKKVLGTVSGAVGDLLFRERNGKNYLGTKPSSFMPGMDEKSISRRKRFALATRLAKPINSISQLKSIWKTVAAPGLSPYNQIVKANYRNTQADSIGDMVKLSPELGFSVQATAIGIDENHLRITLDGITASSGIDPAVEIYFQIAGVAHLSNPLNEENDAHTFVRLLSEEQSLVLDTEINFNINFYDRLSQMIAQYNNRKVFLILLTLDADRNVVNYSNTFFNS